MANLSLMRKDLEMATGFAKTKTISKGRESQTEVLSRLGINSVGKKQRTYEMVNGVPHRWVNGKLVSLKQK